MAADVVTVGGSTNQRQRESGADGGTTAKSGSAAAKTTLNADTSQRAPSSNPGDNMMTKDTAENQSDVDIQQLLQKYGQVQNQFPLTDDAKKRYNKEGFRIRFRLSRAYRGLEKQEILASRPDFSNLNGPRRKKQIQKLMQQLEENLMLFDPDESARRKAQERELERQKLLKQCRENAKKWKNDSAGAKSVQGKTGKSAAEGRIPSTASQHLAEYWGKPARKKGKEPKGDWRIKQKEGEKPWWHKFVKKKKQQQQQKNGLAENGANESRESNGNSRQLDGAKPAEPGEGEKAGERGKTASDAEKFFITSPGSQSDSYSAVEEWQRRNAERKGRKVERVHKLKMASRGNKDKSTPSKGKQDGQNGKTVPTDQKAKDGKSLTDKSGAGKPGLVEEVEITPPSVSQNDPSVGNTGGKNEANKESSDVKAAEELQEVVDQPSYSFMAFGGFSGCKSEASSMTSASSARSEAEFDDDADKNKLDMLLRVQNNMVSGSRDGSRAGSSLSKHRHETEARTAAPVRNAHKQTKQLIQKPSQSKPKSVSFQADRHDSESVEHHPRIELRDPDGQETVLEGAAAAVLPGQVTGAKVKDTTLPNRKAAPGILKDASSTGHKLHRTKSAPATHGHRPKTAAAGQKDESSTGQEAAKDDDKPLKICRYMYTMCNCQRVGRPSTLAKLRQKRKKVVGVITVYGCPDEEERKRSTSPTVCPFCSVFPRYRINAWLKDVPVVTVD